MQANVLTDWILQLETAALVRAGFTALAGFSLYIALSRGLHRMATKTLLTPTMEARVRRLLRWAAFSTIGVIMLQQSGLFNHAWAVLSGFFAVAAVSFVATWSVLSNGVCAVIVLIYRPFEVGDTIEIIEASDKPGYAGRVVDINLMFTKIRQEFDGGVTHLQIPNNVVMQRVLRNRGRT